MCKTLIMMRKKLNSPSLKRSEIDIQALKERLTSSDIHEICDGLGITRNTVYNYLSPDKSGFIPESFVDKALEVLAAKGEKIKKINEKIKKS